MNRYIFILCYFLFHGFVLKGQEKPVNPFTGYNLVVIMDGQEGTLRALTLLAGIHEHPIQQVIVPKSVSRESFNEIRKLLDNLHLKSVQLVNKFDSTFLKPPIKFIAMCLGSPLMAIEAGIPAVYIERIVGIGHESDLVKVRSFFQSDLNVDILMTGKGISLSHLDEDIINKVSTVNGRIYASLLETNRDNIIEDELLAVYLLYPEMIDMKPVLSNPRITYSTDYDSLMMKSVLFEILAGDYHTGDGVAFSDFPVDPAFYKFDVRRIMDSAIARFGPSEWKACVITDEIHGHLGIYSIIGAKMGILAREYFQLGPDKMKVTSFAGSRPPNSCLNDGLQASTGATVGQGLITVVQVGEQKPEAIFEYQGRKIKISLKENFREQIEADINHGIAEYGLLNAGYWKLIRNLSLGYWRDWDREKIFDITNVN